MLSSVYNSVFGPSTNSPTNTNSPVNSSNNTQNTTNAAQNALNGSSNPSSPQPITDTHEVSWIQGAWEGLKNVASTIYSILTSPLVKLIISVLLIAASVIGFIALAASIPPLGTFAVIGMGLVLTIVISSFVICSVLAGGPPDEDDETETPNVPKKPTNTNDPNKPADDKKTEDKKTEEKNKPLTYTAAMDRLKEKEKEIEELKKTAANRWI